MAETLGGLVDRLVIVNIKLYAVQNIVMEAAKKGTGLDSDTTAKLIALNATRNKLMTEVDRLLDESLKAGRAEIDPRFKLG